MAHGRQANALFFANKQIDTQFIFQLTQTRREVGGNPMQLFRSTGQGTAFCHGTEHT